MVEWKSEDLAKVVTLVADSLIQTFNSHPNKPIVWVTDQNINKALGHKIGTVFFMLMEERKNQQEVASYVEKKTNLLICFDKIHPKQIGISTQAFLEGEVNDKHAISINEKDFNEFMKTHGDNAENLLEEMVIANRDNRKQ